MSIPGGFRAAYSHGVATYYTDLTSYRNPHYPGITKVLDKILDRLLPSLLSSHGVSVLDLAAGSGEATLALQSWHSRRCPPTLQLHLHATDPFTSQLFTARLPELVCHTFSFRDVAAQGLQELLGIGEEGLDMVICSFALHLVPSSELFAVLYELSRAARWLVVVAPHKKPEVREEMGWVRVGEEVVATVERVRGRVYQSLNWEGEGVTA